MQPSFRFLIFYVSVLLLAMSTTVKAQVIEPSIGESLTITEDISLPAGKTLRSADTVLLNTSNSSVGNLMVGLLAGASITTSRNNTFLGANAGRNSTGQANTFIGFSAGRSASTGSFNTFIGVQAGINTTTGNSNFIMGTNAGAANTTGTGNFFMGDNSAGQNTTGSYNLYIGANVANGDGVNGDNNVSLGYESGRGNKYGVNNTFIGFRADAGASSLSNATAIGNNAKVTTSNSLILGNSVNVGIGNSAPTSRLHISSGAANQSGLRLENLTSGTTASVNASKFLTVDGAGNVILANYVSGGRQAAATDVFWKKDGEVLQSAATRAVFIGNKLRAAPSGYKLYVEQGILTEKIKVALKDSGEWSDFVFNPDYRLLPLADVNAYIQRNHRLPGVLSAKEMVAQGNDLHKTDAKLLEKIEELTLYTIQLEQTTQKQQAQIDQLKTLVQQLIEKK